MGWDVAVVDIDREIKKLLEEPKLLALDKFSEGKCRVCSWLHIQTKYLADYIHHETNYGHYGVYLTNQVIFLVISPLIKLDLCKINGRISINLPCQDTPSYRLWLKLTLQLHGPSSKEVMVLNRSRKLIITISLSIDEQLSKVVETIEEIAQAEWLHRFNI